VKSVICLMLLGLALLFSPSASATQDAYWGWGSLSSSNPSGACASNLSWSGIACTGFNNWTYTGIEKTSGNDVRVGFRDDNGNAWWTQLGSGANDGVLRFFGYQLLGAPSYQRVYCKYQLNAASWARCWRSTLP